MDQDILQLYKERGLPEYRSVWSQVLLYLDHEPGVTIKHIAAAHGVTHATMSGRIAGMVRAGLVRTEPGPDARTRRVELTQQGADLISFAQEEWDATERAIVVLDQELDGGLIKIGPALARALAERPFADRLRDQLP